MKQDSWSPALVLVLCYNLICISAGRSLLVLFIHWLEGEQEEPPRSITSPLFQISEMDSQFLNVILLGGAFMVLFTAFQATGMISVCRWFEDNSSVIGWISFLAKCSGRSEKWNGKWNQLSWQWLQQVRRSTLLVKPERLEYLSISSYISVWPSFTPFLRWRTSSLRLLSRSLVLLCRCFSEAQPICKWRGDLLIEILGKSCLVYTCSRSYHRWRGRIMSSRFLSVLVQRSFGQLKGSFWPTTPMMRRSVVILAFSGLCSKWGKDAHPFRSEGASALLH